MSVTILTPKTRRYSFKAAFRNETRVIVEANNQAEALAKLERYEYEVDSKNPGEWEIEYLNPDSIQEVT